MNLGLLKNEIFWMGFSIKILVEIRVSKKMEFYLNFTNIPGSTNVGRLTHENHGQSIKPSFQRAFTP